ncbi:MAG TPA: universal stress protein [Ilumatobacteraceae bacterium]|nr:universal stress protein [Ilumatobacteraceae bacterium]
MGFSTHRAVVGVDDSPASQAAQAWATDLVGDVRAVHVAEGAVADELERIADDCGADLIVVGMHAQRRRVLRTLGPVVGTLLRCAKRPVAVVAEQPAAPGPAGSVVVGIGQSAATERAVRWAAAFAAHQGVRLELVRALPHRPVFRPDGLLDLLAFYIDPAMAAEWAAQDIEAFVAEVDRSTNSEVAVDWSVPPGRPGPVLVEAGDHAQLLVIGIHDRTGTDGNEVPSWCRHVLLHAPCPVVFVPG